MKDTRPLSERFDLSYVRRKHFADRFTGKAGLVCALAALGFCGVMVARSDDSPYSCGPLSRPHDMFASQCNKCHAPDMKKGRGYFLPASDDRCLACHANQATLHAPNQIDLFTGANIPGHPELRTSANCAACHIEHRGRDVNIARVPDSFCVRCHEDLQNKGRRPEPPKQAGPPRGDSALLLASTAGGQGGAK